MKLTKENIDQIDKTLYKKYGVLYIDIRTEILDHLASDLEQMKGNFENIFPDYLESKKDFIKKTNVELNRKTTQKGTKIFFSNIFSLKFLIGFGLMTTFIWFLDSMYSKEWVMNNFDTLPFVIPAPISIILLYIMFFSKQKRSSEMLSLLSITNLFFFGYVLWFIHIVRKIDNSLFWIPFFSFFMTLSIAYYFFYFDSIKKHNQKYKLLITQ